MLGQVVIIKSQLSFLDDLSLMTHMCGPIQRLHAEYYGLL